MTRIVFAGAALVAGVLSGLADVPGLHRAKVIGYGWDLLTSSPEELEENAAAFSRCGLDGVSVVLNGRAGTVGYDMREVLTQDGWTKDMLAPRLPALKRLSALPGLRESLVMAWFAPRRRLSWTDDAAWATAAKNVGILAGAAAEAGLKGLMIDNEDYRGVRQWYYDAAKDGSSYESTCARARRRGAEVGRAAFDAHPTARLLFMWLLSEHRPYFICSDPVAERRKIGDLWPAFVDGMLDVIPPGAKLVDGNEHAYSADADRFDFFKHAWNVRQGALSLVAPENRVKYQSQVSVSSGIYLDMYVNANGSGCWYFGPGSDGRRVTKFAGNLAQAVRVADEYVWVYGEKRTIIDWRTDGRQPDAGANKRWLAVRSSRRAAWNDALPGFTAALQSVTDPDGLASRAFAADDAANRAGELLPKGDWGFWQHPKESHGVRSSDAADVPFAGCAPALVASNVVRGCFVKNVPATPGRIFAVSGWMKGRGAIRVTWERGGTLAGLDRIWSLPFADAKEGEWRRAFLAVCAPPGMDTLVVHPGTAHCPNVGEVTKFADMRVVEVSGAK